MTNTPVAEYTTLTHLAFTLPCVPTAQARARHAVIAGHSVAYKSDSQKANERTLEALLAPYAPKTPLAGDVVLEFLAVLPVPRSDSKKARNAKMGRFCARKPDLSNMAKQIEDAMTRLQFWDDDRQVVRLVCEKRYGEIGCWEVSIREIIEEEIHEQR